MQNDETPALQADRAAVATLPIEIRGRHYEVPVAVHVRFVGMAEELSRNVAGQPFIRNLLGFAEHCISAAEEGEDYSVSRPMLDAMTTLGLMEKVGRGKWAPTPAAEQFVQVGNATPPTAVIPAGFVLVPSRMYVDPESWEALPFIIGGPGEPYQSTTLWVGPIEQDDGSTIYGLHASSDECPEEGSVTIAEFAAPNPAQPINPAAIDSRSIGAAVAEHCEGDSPECGPVEHHDSEGVPLCKVCWEGLLSDSTPQDTSQ